jgi:4a-hydroxytetrahydrobiopterin dehydratase
MKLAADDINVRLSGMTGWSLQHDAITRTFTFPAFPDAVAFVTRLGFQAEAADHHPDLHVSYKRVTVEWSTHSEGGVTDKDFEGARQSDRFAETFGAY